ncbi:EAL domain-containing protein [Agilicoccus flavus]|uniref:EAL domain-containing protein n=1 Tax=Agilicoccus flavus TaxID=2775968 RepID=UPI001CF62062
MDCVKLDRSLIARLGLDAEAPQQVRAIIDLVHSLGITEVIAEGVETTEQEAALQDLRCPMVQGWLYGRPATAAATLAADAPAFS